MHENMKLIAGHLRDVGRNGIYRAYEDFVEMSAVAFSNGIPFHACQERENRYLEIVRKYERDDLDLFAKMLALLIDAMGDEITDHLGQLFHHLELHNHYRGQYFTPMPLCELMGRITIDDHLDEATKRNGHVTVSEPACGSGATVIGFVRAFRDLGYNYQTQMHVTAVDVDIRCVHMAYLQLSLLHIPAVIVHGNTLTLEEWSHWHTPAHIIGMWDHKKKSTFNAPVAVPVTVGQLSLFQ